MRTALLLAFALLALVATVPAASAVSFAAGETCDDNQSLGKLLFPPNKCFFWVCAQTYVLDGDTCPRNPNDPAANVNPLVCFQINMGRLFCVPPAPV